MTTPRAAVFVIDDDASMRRALDSLLRSVGLDVRLYASAQEFMAGDRPEVPGCVLLDVRLPGMSGLTCQQELAKAGIALPVIFISGHGDVPMTVRAMKAGAIEFLTKPFGDEALLNTIRDAIQRSTTALGQEAELQVLQRRQASLSAREREVMALVITGLMNKQVGGKLGISEITVKAHRGQVMRKMGATSLADLVNIAAKLGIVRQN